MRVLYFADIRFPLERANGIQTMETCHALAGRGHDVTLAVRPDTQSPARDPFEYYGLERRGGFRIEQAPVAGPAAMRRIGYLSFAIGRALGRDRADVIMTRDLGLASVLVRLPRSLRAPVVYESHGYAPDVASALPDLVATAKAPSAAKVKRLASREAHVWQAADGYVTITGGLAGELTKRFGRRRHLTVIPDGVRLRGGAIDLDPPAGRIVGYAGHLYAWKGVDVLLEALQDVPEATALIVGGHAAEPDLARTQSRAAELGIADRVTFTGLVPPERVPGLLRQASVLVLPNRASAISTSFTSPLKLFEYMAAGRPIVASDLPSLREVLHDQVDALLVPPGDAGALAAAIRTLLADPALARRLAGAAAAAVPQYGWDRRAERLEALFKTVVTADR
jgi:glycosyltransferase involved in cell wall biosynthesis